MIQAENDRCLSHRCGEVGAVPRPGSCVCNTSTTWTDPQHPPQREEHSRRLYSLAPSLYQRSHPASSQWSTDWRTMAKQSNVTPWLSDITAFGYSEKICLTLFCVLVICMLCVYVFSSCLQVHMHMWVACAFGRWRLALAVFLCCSQHCYSVTEALTVPGDHSLSKLVDQWA